MYADLSDLNTRLGTSALLQLADDDGDGHPDAAVVEQALRFAESFIDSHLARRHALPLDLDALPQAADLLKAVTLDLAEFALRSRRPPIPPDAVNRRQQAVLWLQALAAGTVRLPAPGPIPPDNVLGPQAAATGPPRILTKDQRTW